MWKSPVLLTGLQRYTKALVAVIPRARRLIVPVRSINHAAQRYPRAILTGTTDDLTVAQPLRPTAAATPAIS